jgi:hypothetical protein
MLCKTPITGFLDLSIVRYSNEHNISEIGYFRPRMTGSETPTCLVRQKELTSRSSDRCHPPPHLRMETEPASETLCSLECRTVDKIHNLSKPEYVSGCETWSATLKKEHEIAGF